MRDTSKENMSAIASNKRGAHHNLHLRYYMNVSPKEQFMQPLTIGVSIPPFGRARMIIADIKVNRDHIKNGKIVGEDDYTNTIRQAVNKIEVALHKIFLEHKVAGRILTPPQLVDIYRKIDPASQAVLLSDLIDDFKSVNEGKLDKPTLKGYSTSVNQLFLFLEKEHMASDFIVQDLTVRMLTRFETNLRKSGLAASTVQLYVDKLNALMKYAVKQGFILKNPFEEYDRSNMVQKAESNPEDLDRKIAKEDLQRIERTKVDDPDLERMRLIFLFQRWTGFAWKDLAMQGNIKNLIRLDLTGDESIIYNRMKTGVLAIVPLFEETKKILEELKYNINPGPYKVYLRRIRALFTHFGIPLEKQRGTHIARHVFGSEMLEMGFSMESLSRMMGHSTIKETEKVYAKINMDKIRADLNRIRQQQKQAEQIAV